MLTNIFVQDFTHFGPQKLKLKILIILINSEAGYGTIDTKNEMRVANYIFFQNFIKKGKKGKRGMIYLILKKKFDFFQFFNFLLPFQ